MIPSGVERKIPKHRLHNVDQTASQIRESPHLGAGLGKRAELASYVSTSTISTTLGKFNLRSGYWSVSGVGRSRWTAHRRTRTMPTSPCGASQTGHPCRRDAQHLKLDLNPFPVALVSVPRHSATSSSRAPFVAGCRRSRVVAGAHRDPVPLSNRPRRNRDGGLARYTARHVDAWSISGRGITRILYT